MLLLLSANDLYQYYYCPRKIYFMKTLGMSASKRKMAFGKEEQEREKKRMAERNDYFGIEKSRVKEMMLNKYLEDEGLGLCGVIDVLLALDDGTYVPVEIKYSDMPEVTYARRKQLVAYALLVDRSFLTYTKRGVMYFPEQNIAKTVVIQQSDKDSIPGDLSRIRALCASERIPRQAASQKCVYCEYAKMCRTV